MIKFEQAPNCGAWYLSGTVWDQGYGKGFVPGAIVRADANGRTYKDVAGSHPSNPNQINGDQGYWEIVFGYKPVAVSGTIAIVDGSGNLLSPEYPFTLTSNCRGAGAVNQILIDFSH